MGGGLLCQSLIDVQDFFHRLADSIHQCGRQSRERTLHQPSVINRAELIDEQIGSLPEASRCRHAQAEWLGIIHERGGQRNDQR